MLLLKAFQPRPASRFRLNLTELNIKLNTNILYKNNTG